MSDQNLGAPAAPDTFLDDLLAESVQLVADQKAAKQLQSRIRSGRVSKEEQAQAITIELKASWTPVANCEMWDQVQCECGHTHATFTQYMTEYAPLHSGISLSHRWKKVEPEELRDGLPTKAIFNTREVSHCSECSAPPDGAEIIIWGNSQPPVSREFDADPEGPEADQATDDQDDQADGPDEVDEADDTPDASDPADLETPF